MLGAAARTKRKNTIEFLQCRAAYTDKTAFRIGTAKCGLRIDARLEIPYIFYFLESGNWTSRTISGPCRL